MWKKIKIFHHTFGLMLLVVVMGVSSCKDAKPDGSCSYRLSRGGYSPSTQTLLIAISTDTDKSLKAFGLGAKISWLATYDEEKRTVTSQLYPTNSSPFDFAWVPGQAVFVVTQGDRMTLYQKDALGERYSGTAIRCPVNFMYMCCSWNPKGELLAVNCYDLERASSNRLGLYDLKEEKFVISDIVIDHRTLVWENDTTLFVTNDYGNIVEISLEYGTPKLARTIPVEEGFMLFYGMFDDRPLLQTYEGIRLGDKILIELDQPGFKFRVAATKMAIFVSASPTELVVFDRSGREVDRTNPGKLIRFGSPRDQNTVYALTDSTLLRVSVENETLNIHTVCDLNDSRLLVPK